MRVAIRSDASITIGGGHVRRCRALAQALRHEGADVVFVSRALDVTSAALFAQDAADVRWLVPLSAAPAWQDPDARPAHAAWAGVPWSTDARETVQVLAEWQPDWLVVDHYSFDARWHDAVRAGLRCRLLAVDDLADRALHVDILVDHNWADDHRQKYAAHVHGETRLLGGPTYALLDQQFATAPRYAFNAGVRSIGIFMGGTDAGGFTDLALAACRRFAAYSGAIEIVTTSANPRLAGLQTIARADSDITLTTDEPNLARFFATHDLQIGAGGGATWERCCIGAPSIAIATAANQLSVLLPLRARSVVDVVEAERPTAELLGARVRELIADAPLRSRLAAGGRRMVDGRGTLRVAHEVRALC